MRFISCLVLYSLVHVFTLPGLCAQDIEQIAQSKPVQLRGGIDVRGIFYTATGIVNRYPSSSLLASGNMDFQLYGWNMPFAFSLSNKSQQFSQPFNQFGVSPKYKWITLHAGYRNITYSPFTLAGYTMLGGGADLRPGKFRLGFMYGRLNKATVVDTLTQSLTPVAYTRKGLAARVGYGTDQNFFELSLLKAADDSGSLKVNKLKYDSSILPNAFPSENAVAGISNRFTIAKKLVFESNAAVSVYTRDVNSSIPADSAGHTGIIKSLNGMIRVNGSTDLSTAWNAAIAWKEKYYQLKIQYRRIDPNFKSMGAYFLNTDVENYTFAPSFHAFKNKLRFNGSIGFQNDNLDKNKKSTSKKVIGSANVGADITARLGVDLNYSNYSINQQPNTTLFADTLKITQTTYNLSVAPRYIILREALSHMILLSVNYMKLNDFNTAYTGNQAARTLNNLNTIGGYQLRLNRTNTGIGVTFNYTILKSELLKDKNYGITLGGDQSFLKNKWTTRATLSLLKTERDNASGMLINSSVSAKYQLFKQHFISMQGFLISSKPRNNTSALLRKYTELRVEAGYNFNF